ncbi:MAG: MAPEG family protein [Azospirillum sp.]|nr:MAPEG family protein [Azospirillum sp.]
MSTTARPVVDRISALRAKVAPLAVAINLASSIATWLAFWLLMPLFRGPGDPVGLAERLAGGIRLAVIPVAMVLATMIGVMAARVVSRSFNPIDDPESRLYRISQRVLANTAEQTMVFVPCLVALSTVLPAAWLGVMVLLVGLFVCGRLLFWTGYLIHPYARAPGMAMTFNVNIGVVIYLLYDILH